MQDEALAAPIILQAVIPPLVELMERHRVPYTVMLTIGLCCT